MSLGCVLFSGGRIGNGSQNRGGGGELEGVEGVKDAAGMYVLYERRTNENLKIKKKIECQIILQSDLRWNS